MSCFNHPCERRLWDCFDYYSANCDIGAHVVCCCLQRGVDRVRLHGTARDDVGSENVPGLETDVGAVRILHTGGVPGECYRKLKARHMSYINIITGRPSWRHWVYTWCWCLHSMKVITLSVAVALFFLNRSPRRTSRSPSRQKDRRDDDKKEQKDKAVKVHEISGQ